MATAHHPVALALPPSTLPRRGRSQQRRTATGQYFAPAKLCDSRRLGFTRQTSAAQRQSLALLSGAMAVPALSRQRNGQAHRRNAKAKLRRAMAWLPTAPYWRSTAPQSRALASQTYSKPWHSSAVAGLGRGTARPWRGISRRCNGTAKQCTERRQQNTATRRSGRVQRGVPVHWRSCALRGSTPHRQTGGASHSACPTRKHRP